MSLVKGEVGHSVTLDYSVVDWRWGDSGIRGVDVLRGRIAHIKTVIFGWLVLGGGATILFTLFQPSWTGLLDQPQIFIFLEISINYTDNDALLCHHSLQTWQEVDEICLCCRRCFLCARLENVKWIDLTKTSKTIAIRQNMVYFISGIK